MGFAVPADAYDRFMGRYSGPLSPLLADFASVGEGQRGLDVGCGPGALTIELVERVGAGSVSAVDPSSSFVEACLLRCPGVDVREGEAEGLPYGDDTFDVVLAQLVVHFMADPLGGVREMGRVTHVGGVVAACVWDHDGGGGPLSSFWAAVHDLDPAADGERSLVGARQGDLGSLLTEAGLHEVEEQPLTTTVEHAAFEEWWEPFTLGVGPAGAYVAGLDGAARIQLREQCRSLLPQPPFTVTARAWAGRGVA